MLKHSDNASNCTWSLFEAKTKLSELVEQTIKKGPQIITKRGAPMVAVIPFSQFEELLGPQYDFKAFLRVCPIDEVELVRDPSLPRTMEW